MIARVVITTHNRPAMLRRVLNYLRIQDTTDTLDIHVYDDCGDYPMPEDEYPGVAFVSYNRRHGKRNYWRLVNDIFDDAKYEPWSRFLWIPDDVTMKPDAVRRMEETWNRIPDKQKGCLNPLVYSWGRGPNWDSGPPKRTKYGVWDIGWMDCCMWSGRKCLRALDFRVDSISRVRWANNERLGSGVGQQLSQRIRSADLRIYQTETTLVCHGDHTSQMNPNRKGELIA